MKRVHYNYSYIPQEYIPEILILTGLVAKHFNIYITTVDMYHLWRDASGESGYLWCSLDNFMNMGDAGVGVLLNVLGGLLESHMIEE